MALNLRFSILSGLGLLQIILQLDFGLSKLKSSNAFTSTAFISPELFVFNFFKFPFLGEFKSFFALFFKLANNDFF